MMDAVTYAAWRYIPTTHLETRDDRILFPGWQARQVEVVKDAGVSLGVESSRSGHRPFLSISMEMVAAVERAVERQAKT